MTQEPKTERLDKDDIRRIVNSFPEYLRYALKHLGYDAAPIQLKMAEGLACGKPRIGIMAARGYSKTTICSLYVTWRWLRCRHLKVKIISNSLQRSGEITASILHLLKTIPCLSHLVPDRKTVNRHRFRLSGAFNEKDYSLTASSIYSKMSGSRADLIIADDAANDQTNTEQLREVIRLCLQEAAALLHPPTSRPFYKSWIEKGGGLPAPERTQFVTLGTYESLESVYLIPKESGSPHFLRGAEMFHFPALDENDESTFPERFPTEELREIRDKYVSSTYWACQYQVAPSLIAPDAKPFRMDDIQKFVVAQAPEAMSWVAHIDPSFSNGNDSMVMTIGACVNGRIYIIEQVASQNEGIERAFDRFASYLKLNPKVRTITIETNGGAFDISLANTFRKHQLTVQIQGIRATKKKHERLVNDLEPFLHSGSVVLTAKVWNNRKFRDELGAITYTSLGASDDFVDSIHGLCDANKSKIGISTLARIAHGAVM